MPGLSRASTFLAAGKQAVDGRVKPGRDGSSELRPYSAARLAAFSNFLNTRSRFSLDR